MSRSWKQKIGLHPRALHRLGRKPGPLEGLAAEGVEARPAKGVPVADGKTQVVFHAFAQNHSLGVVPLERQGFSRVASLEGNWLRDSEERFTHADKASFMAG